MTKNKLYISDDAPQELKENIAVVQRMMDNMAEFKVKADNGTLTFEDLDELTRRNNALAMEIPPAKQRPAGYPPLTNDMDQLETIAKARALEAENLLKESGGPVYKITTFDQLKELAKMPPAAIGQVVLDAAKEKREKESGKKPKVNLSSDSVTERSFHKGVYIEHLAETQTLLYNAKTVFYDLPYDWEKAEIFEEQLFINAQAFEEFRQGGVAFLVEVLVGEDSESDVEELRGEAAFVLATIETENQDILDELIDTWKINEDLSPQIVKALKFGKSPNINRRLESTLLTEIPPMQATFIEILAYRKAINLDLWEQLRLHQAEPVVEEKMIRAYINNDLPVEDASLESILEDEAAPFYEDALFSGILAGNLSILIKARNRFHEARDKLINLPLYFSCGCCSVDYPWIKRCLDEEHPDLPTARALGLLGMGDSITLLIRSISDKITCKEDWDLQKSLVESLELITGAQIELPFPDILEGPEGKEHEISVVTGWKEIWANWWLKNREDFKDDMRYRRGKLFDLGSCITEMEYPRGNYWTRQYSYYELQARSGKHIAPFHADWYVAEQKESIEKWKQWWEENQTNIPTSQWLYQSKEH